MFTRFFILFFIIFNYDVRVYLYNWITVGFSSAVLSIITTF